MRPVVSIARVVAISCAAISFAAWSVDASAQTSVQGVPNAMQGFTQNRDEPIQIDAASLEMRDKKKEAVFAGDVKVTQGDTTMKSARLVVFYDGGTGGSDPAKPAAGMMKAAQPGAGGSSAVRRLEAQGGVTVTKKDQVVTGQTAIFDTRANLITMNGNVVLTQGTSVLTGDRLVVNMTTGVSRVEASKGQGRVKGLFMPGSQSTGPGGSPAAGGPTNLLAPKSR